MSRQERAPSGHPPLPRLTPESRFFWTAGERGVLLILRCHCGRYVHPPSPLCPQCGSQALEPSPVSGRGTVFSFTVSRHAFVSWPETPYVVAIVELDEQPGLQLTSRIVGCEPEAVRIGMRVSVRFERHEDVHLPLFEPEGARVADELLERRVVIAGIGRSAVGRRLGRSELDLTVEAGLRAIEDAGLRPAEIDGLVCMPGEMVFPPGFAGPSPWRVKDSLGLTLRWHLACAEGPGQYSALMSACMAVATGMARHVLVYRTTAEGTGQGTGGRRSEHPVDVGGITGHFQWLRPFGSVSAAHWIALYYQRYLHEFGARREQVGWLAVTERAHAARNPEALYRDPLTLDAYLSSRMITSPLCLYDCDVPADGSIAAVISTADYRADAPRPLRIEAMGSALVSRPYWDQFRDPTDVAARDAARHLWSRTDLKPADVDVAALYDGFTYITLVWLEALGFCGRGEAADFVDGGKRISLDGELPLNTGGGQLSSGRFHGWGHFYEACLQLRGQCGQRQVQGAEVAVAAAGGGPHGGCLLLTR